MQTVGRNLTSLSIHSVVWDINLWSEIKNLVYFWLWNSCPSIPVQHRQQTLPDRTDESEESSWPLVYLLCLPLAFGSKTAWKTGSIKVKNNNRPSDLEVLEENTTRQFRRVWNFALEVVDPWPSTQSKTIGQKAVTLQKFKTFDSEKTFHLVNRIGQFYYVLLWLFWIFPIP